jgi:hypothetical protein
MLPNIRIQMIVPPFSKGDVVARHALKDPEWTIRSGGGVETDEPVTIHVAPVTLAAVPATESELSKENASLRLRIKEGAAKIAIAEAAAEKSGAEVDSLTKKLAAVSEDYKAAQSLLAEQGHRIQHLETQAKITGSR